MNWFFDLSEKIVKVLTWEDRTVSSIILGVLIIAYFLLAFIPIREIVALGLVNKFRKDGTMFKRRYWSNYECARI